MFTGNYIMQLACAVTTLDLSAEFMATKMCGLVCGDKDANIDEINVCNTDHTAQPNKAYVGGRVGLMIGVYLQQLLICFLFV